jgi:hypothetical protein
LNLVLLNIIKDHMAVATSTLFLAGLFVATTIASEDAKQDAKRKAEQAASAQRKAGAEQAAGNAAQQAAERRRSVREERVRRARILQSSENTGTTGSSGETGGIASLSTGLSSNLGANAGAINRSVNISNFSQQAADFSFASQQSMTDAASFSQLGNLAMSAFSMTGGGGTTPADGQPGSKAGSAF